MDHVALAVSEQERARRFYETYCGFAPHLGRSLESGDAVRELAARLEADGIEIVERWDEPEYMSVKVRDPDGHIVEFFWEPG